MTTARNIAAMNVPLRTVTITCLVATLSYLAAKLGGALVLRPQMVWPLWPGCALLVGVLLLLPRRFWPILVPAGLAGFILYDLRAGLTIRSTALLILADTVEILVAALGVSYAFDGAPRLDSVKSLARYSLFAVILAPISVASVGALALGGDYWVIWRISFFTEALALLTVTPAILSWISPGQAWARKSLARYFEAATLVTGLVLFGYITFIASASSSRPALLYSLVPFLLWSALRFGSRGVSSSMLVVALLSIWGAVHGRGPFTGPEPLNNVLSLQLFLLFSATSFMVLAALVEEHKWAEVALKKSEEKFSKAFRESPMALTLNSAKDHRYLEVNESFEQLTGYSRAEVIGRIPTEIELWVDPAQRVEVVKRLLAEGQVRNQEARFRSKDGEILVGLTSGELIEIDGEPCVLGVTADITDRKRAEEALRRKDEELVQAQSLAQLGSWQWDATTGAFTWSEELYRIHGLDPMLSLPSYKEFSKLFTVESWNRLSASVKEALQTGSVQELELEVVRPDGSKRWVTARGEAIRDAAGRVVHLRGTVQDITERKQAEEARFHHAAVVESSDDAIISKNLDGVILSWNAGAQRIFGYTEAEAVGQSIAILIPPELQDYEHQIRQRLRAGKRFEHYETVRVKKGGGRVHVSLTISPVTDSSGRAVGATKIARDITERKQAEEALRESEQRFRLVANTAPVLIWMAGPDKLCNYFNQTWLEFTGRRLEQELGNGWAEGVHAEDLPRCLDTYTQSFDRREKFRMEYRLRHHHGEYRWVLDIGVPRFNTDGSFAGYIGSCIDVTDRKLAEEALSNLGRRLIEAHEEERTWIARELHDDVNQRIALLAIELERLKQDVPDSAHEFRNRIRGVWQRLSEIGNDLQAISHRLHSSKLEYLGITAAADSFCRELSEQQKVTIKFSHADIPRTVPHEISLCVFRVLQEALQNAVKHSGVRHFKVELRGASDELQLTVRDSGTGFDPEAAISTQGLGLISMQERLRLVGGELSIDSKANLGSTIWARVPLRSGEYFVKKAG